MKLSFLHSLKLKFKPGSNSGTVPEGIPLAKDITMPPSVSRAVKLFAVSLIMTFFYLIAFPGRVGFPWNVTLPLLAPWVLLISMIHSGIAWSRNVFVLFYVIGVINFLANTGKVFEMGMVSLAIGAVINIMHGAGIYLSFRPESNEWFRSMKLASRHPLNEHLRSAKLFFTCMFVSVMMHVAAYGSYYLVTMPDEVDSSELDIKEVDVDFEDIPPDISPAMVSNDLFTESNPAPVEKKEWIEGTGDNAPDAPADDDYINAISGDGTDKDGYYFSFRGDRPPIAIVDFDLRRYYPKEARKANVGNKTVVVRVQIEADGTMKGARVVSRRIGYGFEEAAITVINRVRFRPGYLAGRPTKMTHEIPIRFVLE